MTHGLNRRSFLTGLTALSSVALGSRADARLRVFGPRLGAPETGKRNLVLVQLSGGNDGLSTVVPYADDAYHAARDTIRIAPKEVLRLNDYCGLHPNLRRLHGVFESGRLAVVQGCGYPRPNRSHFKSMEIWHTGHETGRQSGPGWVGRMCEQAWTGDETTELAVHVGKSTPYSLYSTERPPVAFTSPAGYRWVGEDRDADDAYREAGHREASNEGVLGQIRSVLGDAQDSSLRIRAAVARYRTGANYPGDDFGQAMKVVAAMIEGGLGSRVFSVEVGGFDTHETQRRRHDTLMTRLDQTLGTFFADLSRSHAFEDTVVVVFSEFGRRVAENGSKGTDHGVAGPMLVLGAQVSGGLYGRHPSLTDLDDGDLVHTTDFRSVYATVIERWFDADANAVLGARYPQLDLV